MSEELDRYFPKQGPCAFCADGDGPDEVSCSMDARHRIIDAIRQRVALGEPRERVAEDYGVTLDAVRVACEEGP